MYIHNETDHNLIAPSIIVPILLELTTPNSVMDVGCGIGTWLSVFKKSRILDIKGIDGEYVDKILLSKYLYDEEFDAIDLRKPFNLSRKFDLVICLEVAEHLPEISAEDLVDSLCRHGDTIVFSAAIPGQGGQNHLNEQWPSYWAKLFHKKGYQIYDPIRPKIWDDEKIDLWYRQNILIFSKQEKSWPVPELLDIVHPGYFKARNRVNIEITDLNKKISSGKAGIGFSLKVFFKSFLHFFGIMRWLE